MDVVDVARALLLGVIVFLIWFIVDTYRQLRKWQKEWDARKKQRI